MEWPESPMLRRANHGTLEDHDASTSSSRALFAEFAAFFYESMDSATKEEEEQEELVNELSAPSERSDFLHQLEILSKTSIFSSTLPTSQGDSKGAFYYMEWFVTGPDLDCSPVVNPHIKLQCSNGGRIHVDHPCIVQGVDTAVCMHGYHFLNHLADFVGVWCSGNDESELGLTVVLAGVDVTCTDNDGEIAQGISLGQGCGAFGSEEFHINVKESSCDDPTQYMPAETEDENPKCESAVTASEDSLVLLSLPVVSVSASTNSSDDSMCIYDINA
jgi:hypothetical protein